jgi:hypothetical protein
MVNRSTGGEHHTQILTAIQDPNDARFRKRVAEMSSRADKCPSQSDLKARAGVPPAHVCIIMAVPNRLGNELT